MSHRMPFTPSPEVAAALAEGKPLVALESTIISHGLPRPQNLEVAREVEDIVRDHGAVPATIAVIDGVVHIGLDVGPQYRNQGAATAALELSWIWAQENSYHRLEGSTDVSNLAMKKAFENANWSFEGIQKKLFFANGIGQDYLAFSRTL